jgi:probable HAF family extracellular repeat protein
MLPYPMKNRVLIRLPRPDLVRRQPSRVRFVLKSLGVILAMCLASAAFAQNRYQITRIPRAEGANSAALGINSKGEVVGYSFQGEAYQAFLYSSADQSLTDVGSLGGKINAACAINESGQVTGYSQDANGNLLAFLFSRNQPIASLGTLDGASASEAFGINNRGAVVGDSQSGTQNHRPVLFSKNSVQDLGLGRSNEPDALETAFAINDGGQIVGRHGAGNNAFHAFSFINGTTTDFSTLGGTNGEALAINKNGLIVGDSDTADGTPHAFVSDHSQLKDLGTLSGFANASYARGINNSGDIVGESESADQKRAFLYTKGQLIELDRLAENLSPAGFSSLDVAYGINDKGWIVGYGTTSDNLTAAFIAVPVAHGNQGQTGGVEQPQESDQTRNVSEPNGEGYDVFYTGLSSDEGNWVEAGNYGYCFRPRVSENWRPYGDGHWVWTDRGWYWNSNEKFGWATYHYGRWVNIGGTGWCWVPGNQWAPAWVSWRESDEQVGWAPLPPEADVSARQSISTWSDSYYGIGPAAYAFISYSHWREPSYAAYIEPPEQNVQIIRETKNVTNIVNNNNVINNFGPLVQNVSRMTNQNIQQVKIALNPVTDPRANYGQTQQANRLNVTAPPAVLSPQAKHVPSVQNRIANPQVEKGWGHVKPQEVAELQKTIAEQNPPPKDLPSPTPFVNPVTGNNGQVAGSPGATGSPTPAAGQKTAPNLVKPGAGSPKASVSPVASPNAPAPRQNPVPPNLLGAKPSTTVGSSPTVKPSGTPVGSPTEQAGKPGRPGSPGSKQPPNENVPAESPSAPKGTPPNLNASRPSPTPGQPGSPENKPSANPVPKPTGNRQPGQLLPPASATPHNAATPTQEKKLETTPTPVPQGGPANLKTPNPTPTLHQPSNQEVPKPTSPPVSTPRHEPPAIPKPTSEVNATPPPEREIKTPPPQVQHTPVPQPEVVRTPPAERPAQKTPPTEREIKTPPAQVQHTPPPQPEVVRTPPAERPAQKPPPQEREIKTPPPQVQHAPAPQPEVVHTPPAERTAQKPPPPKESQQEGRKHEPEKGKPTPTP